MIALVIAVKVQDDDYYRNDYYAKIGGISLKELNNLEKEMLQLLNFELFISFELYNTYIVRIKQY